MFSFCEIKKIFKNGIYAKQFYNFQNRAAKCGQHCEDYALVVFFCIATYSWGRRRIARETVLTEYAVQKHIKRLRTPETTPGTHKISELR